MNLKLQFGILSLFVFRLMLVRSAHTLAGIRAQGSPFSNVRLFPLQVVYNVYPPHPWASAALQGLHLVLLGAAINYEGAPAAAGGGRSGGSSAKAAAAAVAPPAPTTEQATRQIRRRR